MSTPAPKENVLDRIITIGSQAEKLIGVWMPQVSLGIQLVKTLIGIWNQNRQPGDPEIPIPPDNVLIEQLRAASLRVQERGQAWLDAGMPAPEGPSPSSSTKSTGKK